MILEHLFDPIIRHKAVLQRTVYVHTVSHSILFGIEALVLTISCCLAMIGGQGQHGTSHSSTTIQSGSYATPTPPSTSTQRKTPLSPKSTSRPAKSPPSPAAPPFPAEPPSPSSQAAATAASAPPSSTTGKIETPDVKVNENLPRGVSYETMMRTSKFCLCPSGHEVASPRVAEAIFAECVPVLISRHYVPPFRDVLNWDAFSVSVSADEIPRLKAILAVISDDRSAGLRRNVKLVQRHVVLNYPPKRYDVFHMIVHSV